MIDRVLHVPRRAERLEGFEHHLSMAAHLSRALWGACFNEDAFADERDRNAMMELASAAADHASAALFTFHRDNAEREGKTPAPAPESAEPLDALSNAIAAARSLDMAIGGALTLSAGERDALDSLTSALMKSIESLHRELSEQHRESGEAANV